jgi:hypothetical protein
MRDKGSPNKVCNFLPHVGKEIHTKVEKDFTVLLATPLMVSNVNIYLRNELKILYKNNRL